MKKYPMMPVTRALLILASALPPIVSGFALADTPPTSGKTSPPSSTVVAVDPVKFNWVDGEPIHYTVYKTISKKQ